MYKIKNLLKLFCIIISFNTNAIEISKLNIYTGYRTFFLTNGESIFPFKDGTEVGIIGNIRFNDHLDFYNHIHYNSALPLSFNNLTGFNYFSYHDNITNDVSFDFRGGKIRSPMFLFNQQKHNPFTRPGGVIEPQGIYWSVLKQTLSASYGISLSFNWEGLEIYASTGSPIISEPEHDSLIWTGTNEPLHSKFGNSNDVVLTYSDEESDLQMLLGYRSLNLGLHSANNANNEIISFGINKKLFNSLNTSLEFLIYKNYQLNWDWNRISKGISLTVDYDINEYFDFHTNFNYYVSSIDKVSPIPSYIDHTYDYNFGIGFHYDNLLINVDAHWIHGGHWLDLNQMIKENSFDQYREYWVIGANVVYYFDLTNAFK
jgi:hypothetical protein